MSNLQPGSGYGFNSGGFGFTLNTVDPFAAFNMEATRTHPLQIFNLTYDAPGSAWLYQVIPGTLNNVMPEINEDSVWVPLDRTTSGIPNWPKSVVNFSASTPKTSYIYLRAGVDPTTKAFPSPVSSDETARIISSGTTLTDTDEYGYVLLCEITEGTGNAISFNQYVSSSLWGDRIKLGTITAKYYYARI